MLPSIQNCGMETYKSTGRRPPMRQSVGNAELHEWACCAISASFTVLTIRSRERIRLSPTGQKLLIGPCQETLFAVTI